LQYKVKGGTIPAESLVSRLISVRKGSAMVVIARVIGLSLLTAGMGAGLARVLFWNTDDCTGIALLLGCVGAVVGALAGTARETAMALRQKPSI
jgi:hypothetical protein